MHALIRRRRHALPATGKVDHLPTRRKLAARLREHSLIFKPDLYAASESPLRNGPSAGGKSRRLTFLSEIFHALLFKVAGLGTRVFPRVRRANFPAKCISDDKRAAMERTAERRTAPRAIRKRRRTRAMRHGEFRKRSSIRGGCVGGRIGRVGEVGGVERLQFPTQAGQRFGERLLQLDDVLAQPLDPRRPVFRMEIVVQVQ